MIEYKIMSYLSDFDYGLVDKYGKRVVKPDSPNWHDEFYKVYYLQTPEELLKSKCGVCWDFVELERKLFQDNMFKVKTYFIYIVDDVNLLSHAFLTFEKNDKFYWFENSWDKYRGIHEYETSAKLILDVKYKFKRDNKYNGENVFIYEYDRPKTHITCDEFYKYIETQRLIKTNKPLYFYHVVDKNADISNGLISLKYMYDNKMYKLFDKNAEKYIKRITNDWNLPKYKKRTNLTRKEIIDALNIFRGEFGASYIFFFRYPLDKKLGSKIEELLKFKDIYRININDEEVIKSIKDIFYGYDGSCSDNAKLDRKYYENVTKKEYFAKYDDSLEINFSTLNHIAVAFENDICPLKFLEKVY